jgi:hypothetical protein
MTVPTWPSSARQRKSSTTTVESKTPSEESQMAKRRRMMLPGVTGERERSQAEAAWFSKPDPWRSISPLQLT